LDAEAIRDQMLALSGEIDLMMGGPSIPTIRIESGEVVVTEDKRGAFRRSLYLNQKRTQVVSFLNVFDAPSIVFNSVRRNTSTMSLQSLSLLNSEFAVRRARATEASLSKVESNERVRIAIAFSTFYSRKPNENELNESVLFLDEQTRFYAPSSDAKERAWQDFFQSLFASSELLYVD
jgi:hypothetical protein